jgi:hypothetical protein
MEPSAQLKAVPIVHNPFFVGALAYPEHLRLRGIGNLRSSFCTNSPSKSARRKARAGLSEGGY